MVRQMKLAGKSKRNQIVYPIPRILSEVPNNEQIDHDRRSKIREKMVYRL